MGNWRCCVCDHRQSSKNYKRTVKEKHLWSSYTTFRGPTAKKEDVICQKCYLKIRKQIDGLGNYVRNGRVMKRNRQWRRPITSRSDPSPGASFQPQLDDVMEFDQSASQSQSSHDSSLYALPNQSQAASSQLTTTTTNSQNSTLTSGSGLNLLLGVKSCNSTQNRCFLCRNKKGRCRVPKSEVRRVWSEKKIKIPEENRCCRSHLQNGKFSDEAMELIVANKENTKLTYEETGKWIHALTEQAKMTKAKLGVDFDDESLTNEDYEILCGVEKSQFDQLLSFITSKVKNSKNRTQRNALGMLLMKLHTNMSHDVLKLLFRINNKSTVSDTIHAVADALDTSFVNTRLGYKQMTREEFKNEHTVESYAKLLGANVEQLMLILDATYLYIEKSSDFEFQRATYHEPKKKNVLKPMMVITTTGRIVEAEGLYLSNGKNNDAKILEHMLKDPTSISSILEEEDVLILDRGFRDVIVTLQAKGLEPRMPNLLRPPQKQFTTTEANNSRSVTLVRWLVEAVNGRIKKKWKFFYGTIANSHIPYLRKYFRLACAIINEFCDPLMTDSDLHDKMIQTVLLRMHQENEVKKIVEDRKLDRIRSDWILASGDTVEAFPVLSKEDLLDLTLGTYQLKQAKNYVHEHLKQDERYNIYVHKEDDNLIQAKLQSRFHNNQFHCLWIRM